MIPVIEAGARGRGRVRDREGKATVSIHKPPFLKREKS